MRSAAPAAEPPAVALVDADGRIVGWNEAAGRLLGYRREEVLGRPARGVLFPETELKRFPPPDGWAGTVRVRHRAGHALALRLHLSPIVSADGAERWLVTVAKDERGGLMEALLRRMPLQVCLWDPDLRLTWANETAAASLGLRESELRGQRVNEFADRWGGDFATGAVEQVMLRVLREGTPVVDREFNWQPPGRETMRLFSLSLFRLEDRDGRPLGVCSLALDLSRSSARARLALLTAASAPIGTTLDVARTAQELADLAVPLLADYCAVDLGEAPAPGGQPPPRRVTRNSAPPVCRRAALSTTLTELPDTVRRPGEYFDLPADSPLAKVFVTGRPYFRPASEGSASAGSGSSGDSPSGDRPPGDRPARGFLPRDWSAREPVGSALGGRVGVHSLMVVPLRARGEVLGVVVLTRIGDSVPFGDDDLFLAEQLAARAAFSLDNARRYARERAAALTLQRSLMPRGLSGGGVVELATRYLPSDRHDGVGGDWFDAIRLPRDRVALIVGDVVGHGIHAAATMGRMRSALRALTDLELPPVEVLTRLDHLVIRLAAEEESDGGEQDMPTAGATCLYALYDPATRRCTVARAGHLPPAVVTPGGEVVFPELPPGVPLGFGLADFEQTELELAEGSVLALYTDGLVERRDEDIDAGLERLARALARRGPGLEELCSSVVDELVGEGGGEDDVALLLARTLPRRRPR